VINYSSNNYGKYLSLWKLAGALSVCLTVRGLGKSIRGALRFELCREKRQQYQEEIE